MCGQPGAGTCGVFLLQCRPSVPGARGVCCEPQCLRITPVNGRCDGRDAHRPEICAGANACRRCCGCQPGPPCLGRDQNLEDNELVRWQRWAARSRQRHSSCGECNDLRRGPANPSLGDAGAALGCSNDSSAIVTALKSTEKQAAAWRGGLGRARARSVCREQRKRRGPVKNLIMLQMRRCR